MSAQAGLPGFWRFAWMFFMQPISLHLRLLSAGIEKPEAAGWSFFRHTGSARLMYRIYLLRLAFVLLVSTSSLAVAMGLASSQLGIHVNWAGMTVGVTVGIVVGVTVGAMGDVLLGVTTGIALGVVLAAALGAVAFLFVAVGVAGEVALGINFSIARGEARGAVFGIVVGVTVGMAIGLAFVVVGVVTNVGGEQVVAGIILGVIGIAYGASMILMFFRLPIWFLEMAFQCFASAARRFANRNSFALSPVFWHELSYLPLPFLGQEIESVADADPDLARRALAACAIAPGQRAIGRRTLERLQARELERLARVGAFRQFIDAETRWLPSEEGASPIIRKVREVARYLRSAEGSSFPHHRVEHLRNGRRALGEAFRLALLPEGSTFHGALSAWHFVLADHSLKAQRDAATVLPNPFRAGEPLAPERGREVFRGREASIRAIEAHLALAAEARSILLLGPRRTGKTSLLKMLPDMLPDAICIFFDLQGNPVETPEGFFGQLAEETRRQARRTRDVELPGMPPGPPFEAAGAWIDALEERLGERRLLLCLDEFETLERAFGGRRDDLLRLMGLIRSTIQHRRRVRILIAGEAPFEELDGMWDAHFVSLREVRLGHLEPSVAVDLVRRPAPEFPAEAIPEEVAEKLVERTGAQPFLVQLFAQLLVSRLNDDGRREATLVDLDAVEVDALQQVGSYFRDLWNRAPPEAKTAIEALARGEAATPTKLARRWLERRCLIDGEGRLTIPVFGRFVLEEILP